jgi:hypothetical protein
MSYDRQREGKNKKIDIGTERETESREEGKREG